MKQQATMDQRLSVGAIGGVLVLTSIDFAEYGNSEAAFWLRLAGLLIMTGPGLWYVLRSVCKWG